MRKHWLMLLLSCLLAFMLALAGCGTANDGGSSNGDGTQSENSSSGIEDSNGSEDSGESSCMHEGGEATCKEQAICTLCGEAYGDLAEHKYTKLDYGTSSHWYECECGEKDKSTIEAHKGGTATCDQKAACEVCGKSYGDFVHEYTKLNSNESTHWYECECGEKDMATIKSHTGGTATCNQKAACGVCGEEYGDYAAHMGGEATCTQKAICGACGEEYGDYASHTGGEATCTQKAVCTVCGEGYGYLAAHSYTQVESNETTHWYECTCGAKNTASEKEHDYTVLVQGDTTYRYDCECGAKGEEQQKKSVEECVDFVVDVETGREIRVLQLTDVQTISSDQKRYETRVSGSYAADIFKGYQRYIGQVIERYDPDFIIMTGDNTYGEFDDYGEQHLALIEFMDTFKTPWAPVFGNHDNESNMGVDWQCDQFESSKYCLFKQRELTGNGNYSVGLTQGGELKRVFYMLDSNGCGNMSAISLANGHSTKSVGFGQDQIDWYSESMAEINRSFPNAKISMAFHIQIYAFEKAMRQYKEYNASTIRTNPINLDKLDEAKEKGDFGYIGREPKGPWDYDNKVWNTIKEYGVDSVFVGHEHCNSASIMYEGVRLTYGQKSSTFDRYNLTAADGSITNTSVSYSGTPIMGGTFINLSEEDGSIADAGLYLYDHELGWEKPVEEETKITIDTIPEGATVTEFDFNGSDFDATVTTEGIKGYEAKKVTDTSLVPEGFTGDVYSLLTSEMACVGVKFPKAVNANNLRSVIVKMYVETYAVTSGKTPLLRIYNDSVNSRLTEQSYADMGGEFDKWVSIDILPMLKSASGIIADGELAPFTFVYRFYGAEAGTVYFDSITVVSNGDMYVGEQEETPDNERAYETVRDEKYYQYSLSEFDGVAGTLSGGSTVFMEVAEESYSIKFSVTPNTFNGTLCVFGYTNEGYPQSGIGVILTKTGAKINKGSGTVSLATATTYEVEVGFVSLFNGNTVYTFVKVNGTLVAWELMEAYGKTVGNVAIVSANNKDSFTIA